MLTTVCRAAFPVAPMHIGDATVAATGKSYLLSLIAAIATGRLMPVISAGKSEEEMEKRIGAAVIMGQSFVCIDNVNGEIGGDALCQLVEQPRPSIRVLGLSKLVEVEASSVTFFADGNNIVVTGDLSRRAIVFKLDAKMERPELRTFTGDPMKSVMDDRGKYIAACLTICRAYIAADRPNPMPQIASFNDWSNVVRSALVWLGEEDPVKSMDTSSAEDPVKNALLTMLTAWIEVMGTSATLREVIDQCNAVDQFRRPIEDPHICLPGIAERGFCLHAPPAAGHRYLRKMDAQQQGSDHQRHVFRQTTGVVWRSNYLVGQEDRGRRGSDVRSPNRSSG